MFRKNAPFVECVYSKHYGTWSFAYLESTNPEFYLPQIHMIEILLIRSFVYQGFANPGLFL